MASLDELNTKKRGHPTLSDLWFDDDETPACSDEEIEVFFRGVKERTRALQAQRKPFKRFQVPRADALGSKEQIDLQRQIGVPVSTWSEAKQAAAASGLCFAEKGTAANTRMGELRKWAKSGKNNDERGPAPKCLPKKDLHGSGGDSMVKLSREILAK